MKHHHQASATHRGATYRWLQPAAMLVQQLRADRHVDGVEQSRGAVALTGQRSDRWRIDS